MTGLQGDGSPQMRRGEDRHGSARRAWTCRRGYANPLPFTQRAWKNKFKPASATLRPLKEARTAKIRLHTGVLTHQSAQHPMFHAFRKPSKKEKYTDGNSEERQHQECFFFFYVQPRFDLSHSSYKREAKPYIRTHALGNCASKPEVMRTPS